MIPVQNIYFMLSYAFQILKEERYQKVAAEECDSATELCAAILERGIASQVKRGMERGYVQRTEALTVPRGKIEVSQSIREMSHVKKQIVCSYDEFAADTYMNRIIKSTVFLLLRSDISLDRKKKLRKLMKLFLDVELLDVRRINWRLHYNQNNQTYRMLMSVCYLIVNGLLQTEKKGTLPLMGFELSMPFHQLYERFVYEYFRQEFPMISISKPHIKWQVDNDIVSLLPKMKTDIVLSYGEKILIIDTKAYGRLLQSQYGAETIHSQNLYQIFTYVKNKEYELRDILHEVSGMLLYAKTDEGITLENDYLMSGNLIAVRTLDLNCSPTEIAEQLNHIVKVHFGIVR